MSDVEIVIKLSEKNCEHLKRLGALWVGSENGSAIVSKALLEGTILPKGHGDLIDRKELLNQPMDAANYPSNYVRIAQTIIEADEVESEE